MYITFDRKNIQKLNCTGTLHEARDIITYFYFEKISPGLTNSL